MDGERNRTAQNEAPLGEVVASNTTRLIAQCPRDALYEPPALGAFVRVTAGRVPIVESIAPTMPEDPFADPEPRSESPAFPLELEGAIYAVVCGATTGSSEPGRRPAAYGLDEAQLREEQPQIFDLLATEFTAVLIGFLKDGRVRAYLPPRPPRLHAFVTPCSSLEIRALTDSLDFLRTLLSASSEIAPEELLAASLREAYAQRDSEFDFLVRAGKRLALLLRDEPDRLASLLRKLEP